MLNLFILIDTLSGKKRGKQVGLKGQRKDSVTLCLLYSEFGGTKSDQGLCIECVSA